MYLYENILNNKLSFKIIISIINVKIILKKLDIMVTVNQIYCIKIKEMYKH